MPEGNRRGVDFTRLPNIIEAEAPLLHRGAGEGGEADDIADGVDVLDRGLQRSLTSMPAVGGDAGGLR